MAFTNATVLVSKGTITGVATGRMTVAGGTRTIELDGKYLMPGMIDAPEVLAAEYHERPQPAEQFFVDNPDMADLMTSGLKGPANLRRMGTAMVICGVDWIKANATARAGVPETDPREPYFSEVELKALVETGADRNVLGAAHAHGDEGGRATVLAGVRSIEHGTYLSSETLRFMARRGTYLVPTVATRAAELLRIEARTGKIASGYDADLIVMDRNPLEDIGALHDLLLVVNNGKVVLDRLGW